MALWYHTLFALQYFVHLNPNILLNPMSEISPWTGRFYSLLDPSYAKNNIPIIASVSEHQPTTWSSFYFDLQFLVFMFPGERYYMTARNEYLPGFPHFTSVYFSIAAGLYCCFKKLTDANIFIIMYGVTSIYFAVSHKLIIYKTSTLQYDMTTTFPFLYNLYHLYYTTHHPSVSIVIGRDGASDAGTGSGDVYSVWDRRLQYSQYVHEEPGLIS